jgi:hypothetical protein
LYAEIRHRIHGQLKVRVGLRGRGEQYFRIPVKQRQRQQQPRYELGGNIPRQLKAPGHKPSLNKKTVSHPVKGDPLPEEQRFIGA